MTFISQVSCQRERDDVEEQGEVKEGVFYPWLLSSPLWPPLEKLRLWELSVVQQAMASRKVYEPPLEREEHPPLPNDVDSKPFSSAVIQKVSWQEGYKTPLFAEMGS